MKKIVVKFKDKTKVKKKNKIKIINYSKALVTKTKKCISRQQRPYAITGKY